MEPSGTVKKRLEGMGSRLQALLIELPDEDPITDTLDYVVGALYALRCAIEAGLTDRAGRWHETYRTFLANSVLDIVAGMHIHPLWLGGFHFNSAIQRLAATYDRIPGLLGAGEGKARDRMKSVCGSEGR